MIIPQCVGDTLYNNIRITANVENNITDYRSLCRVTTTRKLILLLLRAV